ncbi:MAG: hypothetical protein IT558_01270 [Alphaproteobacteria bacterium]|nr:hypothetical protein [Alphaproteobacteria bacterium]
MKNKCPVLLTLMLASTAISCSPDFRQHFLREETVNRLARPVFMNDRVIPAGNFALTAYERMHKRYAPADVYIEGDGRAWLGKSTPSMDPTPRNPVALHLATRDQASNVVWLARPCQYTKMVNESTPCDQGYWTNRRFSPEVLDAYNGALDEIKKRYDIEGFNLIGYSGGGAIAAILAAQRHDILSLRTVAGNLDHKAHSVYHNVSYMTGSLNPPDYAEKLRTIPQVHFIGGQDEVIPPAVLESYLQAVEPSNCIQYQFIQEASHDEGWVDKWPEFLNVKPACRGPVQEMDVDFAPPPEPIYTIRETPEKP